MSYSSITNQITRVYRFLTASDSEDGDVITQAQHDFALDEVVTDVNEALSNIATAAVTIDDFTGDGATLSFAVTGSPTDENTLFVHIDGIYQNKDTFSLSGGSVLFSTAPPNLSDIEIKQFAAAPVDNAVLTFAASDATPSVSAGKVFLTHTSALTITDFDNGSVGQIITVISKGAITFDTTGTDLTGSSVDIVTASGDTTQWICEDGTTWLLLGYVDASVDNSAGA